MPSARFETKNRTVCDFGYSYHSMLEGDFSFFEIPAELTDAIHQACEALELEIPVDYFNSVILAAYPKDGRLGAHIDNNEKNRWSRGGKLPFYFDEHIVGVVVNSNKNTRFFVTKNEQEDHLYLPEEDGLCFSLQGEARHIYKHGVRDGKRGACL